MKPAISWDFRASRCGHNFEPQKCPSGECGYREALQKIAVLTAERDRLAAELRELREGLQPGTPEAIMDGLFDFAERECGHNPVSARHALSTMIEWVAASKAERDQLHAALKAVEWMMAGFCPKCNRHEAQGHAPGCIVGLAMEAHP